MKVLTLNLPTKVLQYMRKIKLKEILIIISIIVISALLLLSVNIFSNRGITAIVTIDSKIVKKVDLTKNQTYQIDNITLEVKNKKIRVLYSDCPDKICTKKEFISKLGESIVCMPNKLIVEIGETDE